jgi:hypothetical protein
VPRIIIAALFLLLLGIPLLTIADDTIDHLYLLKLLDTTLYNAVQMNSNYYQVIIQIMNTELPGQLGYEHRETYSLLSQYFYILRTMSYGKINASTRTLLIQKMHNLELNLQTTIGQYVGSLMQNAEDQAEALTLHVNISSKLNTLINKILPELDQEIVNYPSHVNFNMTLSPSKTAYSPGEHLNVIVKPRQGYENNLTGENPPLTQKAAAIENAKP